MIIPFLVGAVGVAVGVVVWETIARSKIKNVRLVVSSRLDAVQKKAEVHREEQDRQAEETLTVRRKNLERERSEAKERVDRLERRAEELERQLESRSERVRSKSKDVETRKREFFQAQKEQRQKKRDLNGVRAQSRAKLCELAELSSEQGAELYLRQVDESMTKDVTRYVHMRQQALEEEIEDRSRRILSIAMERCTFSHVVDTAVSVTRFTDPGNRNRVAGRDGANLKKIKEVTGIEIIIDEASPDIFFYSGFDGVAREVVRRTVDKLAKASGRIEPQSLDRLLKRFRDEVDRQVFRAGRMAVNSLGLRRIQPEIIRLLGRLQYRSSYGQNVLLHSQEVAYLAGLVAAELGLNRKLSKRGALLHDIGKAVNLEMEGGHPEIGAELAKKYGEKEAVIQPILMHHESTGLTQMTELTKIGDSISGSRPGARRDTSEKYLMRLEQIMTIVNGYPGIETSYSMQAGREIWVILDSDQVDDEKAVTMCAKMASEIEENVTYPGKIKLTMIREARSVAVAH